MFDFTVKEDEVSEILDFDIAKEIVDSSQFILARESIRFSDVEINIKHTGALIALNELFTIAEAWNKQDDFVPDFANHKQAKWYPFFEFCRNGIQFNTAFVVYATGNVSSCFSCFFKSRERAEQFGKQFIDLYNQVFLS